MLDSMLYILASCIEGIAFFFITFGLFRISIRDYIKEVTVSIVVVSLGTYLLSEHQSMAQFTPLINLLILIIFLICFFRVSFPHTILIIVSGYIVCMVIQWVLINTLELTTGWTLLEIKNSIVLRTTIQILSSTLIAVVSLILRKYTLWFTFVPYSTSLNFRMTKSNISLLITTTTTLFVFGVTLKYSSLIFGFSIWIICLITLMVISFRREFQVD